MIERRFLFGRELKPGQEVEGFALIARMVELARDSRSIIESDRQMRSTLVLLHGPPFGRFSDWDQRRAGRTGDSGHFVLDENAAAVAGEIEATFAD